MTLVIVLAGLFYVAWRIDGILPLSRLVKVVLLSVYGLAAVSLVLTVTKVIDYLPMTVASAMYVLGNSWLIFMIYALILFGLMDILRLMNLLPPKLLKNSVAGSVFVLGLTAIVMTYGAINYRHKYREEITIASSKIEKPLKVVLLSDLHAGYHNRYRDIRHWVDIVNGENPDLILLGGDLIDRSLRAVTADHDASALKHFKAPVYSCLGNHEYYAGVEESCAFYRTAGITLLKDSLASVCGITVIGRDDKSNEERKALYKLVKKVPRGQFVLLLDHQPNDLLEAQLSGVDFQFSGHTHNGQVWPVSLLVFIENELAHGYLQKGNTRYYVSSGMGIWGGKFRIGTRSEYLVLNLVPETVATTPQN